MIQATNIVERLLPGLPDPDELSTSVSVPAQPLPNNTHIHLPPNFSAFDSISEAVSMAAGEDVRVLGMSNYYDYTVYAGFAELARSHRVFPLFGTEIIILDEDLMRRGIRVNDPANPGKMYICGKGISRFSPLDRDAAALLQVIRDKDSLRISEMIVRLNQVFRAAGFDAALDDEQVKEMVVRRHGSPRETVYLQERHVAQAFQEALAAQLPPDRQLAVLERAYGVPPAAPVTEPVATQNEIRARLMKAGKPGYVPETFVDYAHARKLILALGGIPCYPVLADGVTPPCEFEADPEELVQRLRERQIYCAEFIPDRNTPEVLSRYVRALRGAGIVVTAGTEHNTRDRIPLTPACKGGTPLPGEAAELFWEGACVVAAHQVLVARGLPGLVDGNGVFAGTSADREEHVARLRRIGAGLIAAFAG